MLLKCEVMSSQHRLSCKPFLFISLALTCTATALIPTPVSAAGNPKAIVAQSTATPLTERDQIYDWIQANLVGKTISLSSTTKIDEGRIEAEFSAKRTFTNLQKTTQGLTLDNFTIIEQTNYDLDDNGQRMGDPRNKNRVNLSRWFIKQKKSSGKVIGYSTGISSTSSDPTGSASQLSMKLESSRLILNTSTVGYSDFFAQGGQYKPGASATTSVYEVVNGKLRLETTSKVFNVDPETGERTATGETRTLIYEET